MTCIKYFDCIFRKWNFLKIKFHQILLAKGELIFMFIFVHVIWLPMCHRLRPIYDVFTDCRISRDFSLSNLAKIITIIWPLTWTLSRAAVLSYGNIGLCLVQQKNENLLFFYTWLDQFEQCIRMEVNHLFLDKISMLCLVQRSENVKIDAP